MPPLVVGRTPFRSAPLSSHDDLLAGLAVSPGLCSRCEHLRASRSPGRVFVRCALAAVDPSFPRYPRLPVVDCGGFRETLGPVRTEPEPVDGGGSR